MLEEVLYPDVPTTNWQMLTSERMALTGLLARIRPRHAVEVGVYYGGSLSLIAQFCDRVWALDIDPEVPQRFAVPSNVELRIGDATSLLRCTLDELDAARIAINFVLIDADHSADGVQRDIETVIHRPTSPCEPMFMVMHDSGNPECRRGIASASWASCPYVHHVELDFVPGQIIEHEIRDDRSEVWGGFALAYLGPEARTGDLAISAGSATTVAAIQHCA
ncbi:MAG: class I SAM-dependent methyltransferase, partial [Solirubrobacteraceae bacterium]